MSFDIRPGGREMAEGGWGLGQNTEKPVLLTFLNAGTCTEHF